MRPGQKASGVIILKLSCVRPQPGECDLGARAAHAKVYIIEPQTEPSQAGHVRLLWECGEFVQGRLEDLFPLIGPRLALFSPRRAVPNEFQVSTLRVRRVKVIAH
jgi:hypothetical protein